MIDGELLHGTPEDIRLVESPFAVVCSSKPDFVRSLQAIAYNIPDFPSISTATPFLLHADQHDALSRHPSISASLLRMATDEQEFHVPDDLDARYIDGQIRQTTAQALYKARLAIPSFLLAHETGGIHADRLLYMRDTTQFVDFGRQFEPLLIGQSHPGTDKSAQLSQTKDMINARKIVIITVNALFAGRFPTHSHEDIIHILSAIRSGAFGYPEPKMSYITRAAVSVVVMRFRDLELSALHDNDFANIPGGLQFDHVLNNIECCVLDGNVALSKREAHKADIDWKWFGVDAQWISLTKLPTALQQNFIRTYKGIVPQQDRLSRLLNEGHEYITHARAGGVAEPNVEFAVFQ